jgi:hypothetical protein
VRLNSPQSTECLRRNARIRMSEQTEGPASRPRLIRVETVGRRARALRFVATAPSQLGLVEGLIDAVHVRVGRGIGALAIVSGPAPVGEALYDDLVAAFRRRLHGALG